jgi:hypothetical protein
MRGLCFEDPTNFTPGTGWDEGNRRSSLEGVGGKAASAADSSAAFAFAADFQVIPRVGRIAADFLELMLNCCPYLCTLELVKINAPGIGISERERGQQLPLVTSRAAITTVQEPQEQDSSPPTGCCPPRRSPLAAACGPIATGWLLLSTVHRAGPRTASPCTRPHRARHACLLRAQSSSLLVHPIDTLFHHPSYTALLFSSRCRCRLYPPSLE